MNFLFLLKNKHEYDVTFMIVNRLSKCLYSLSCIKKITAKNMTRLYVVYIYWIYESSDIIVSDCDSQFILNFWEKFCKILGTKLKLSTAHHSQMNSQTEIINQHIMQCLHLYVNYYQNDWSELLSIVNFVTVTLLHESTDLFLFKVKLDYESWIFFDWKSHVRSSTVKEQLNRNQAQ